MDALPPGRRHHGGAQQVASGVDTFVESSPIGLDGAGTATFAWVPSTRSFDGGISVRSRAESGAWSAPQNLPGLNVYRPQLAVTGNGSAVLTWGQSKTTRRPNDRQIAISARSPGGNFSAPQIVGRNAAARRSSRRRCQRSRRRRRPLGRAASEQAVGSRIVSCARRTLRRARGAQPDQGRRRPPRDRHARWPHDPRLDRPRDQPA